MKLSKVEFKRAIIEATKILTQLPAVLRISEDVLAVGDVHGDLVSVEYAKTLQEKLGLSKIVFLGDFVDRGDKQIETLYKLCTMLTTNPENVILLRGNHEDLEVCSHFGFKDVIRKRGWLDLMNIIGELFASLPIYLIKEGYALFAHGGIHYYPTGFNLEKITKPGSVVDDGKDLAFGALWNDPIEADLEVERSSGKFSRSSRGWGVYTYHKETVAEALATYDLKYLIRAHTALKSGIKWYNDKTLSTFSASSGVYNNFTRAYVSCISKQQPKPYFFSKTSKI